jgi:hypothetical protein
MSIANAPVGEPGGTFLLLEATELKMDTVLQTERTIYSLRHTAICMRIILSQGKVNIFNLVTNAGTTTSLVRSALRLRREEPTSPGGRRKIFPGRAKIRIHAYLRVVPPLGVALEGFSWPPFHAFDGAQC